MQSLRTIYLVAKKKKGKKEKALEFMSLNMESGTLFCTKLPLPPF